MSYYRLEAGRFGNGLTTGAAKAPRDANADDLTLWKSQFGGGGFAGPGALLRGVVTYVGGPISAAPEPVSMVHAGFTAAAALAMRRRAAGEAPQ